MRRQPADDSVEVTVFAAQFVQLPKQGIPVCQHMAPSIMWSRVYSIHSRPDGEMHDPTAESCKFSMLGRQDAGIG
ncbi:hypothetical protein AA13594_2817 [Gluconacetobacter azotocaptans DSM 13594]|nr:hypothetical protein AA13594_2817 [Gluconacetobacter azotocaptans DSM 13594]